MAKRELYRVVPSWGSVGSSAVLYEGTLAQCKRWIERKSHSCDPAFFVVEKCDNPEAPPWARRWWPVRV